MSPEDAAKALTACGLSGKILYTPGHSDDSISLIVGSAAFVGDLPPLCVAESYGSPDLAASWRKIAESGVTRVYPAHGEEYGI